MNISLLSRLAVTGASRADTEAVSRRLALASSCEWISVGDNLGSPLPGHLSGTVGMALRGFEQRVDLEARTRGSFISDGAVLTEWAEAEARRRLRRSSPSPFILPFRLFEKKYLEAHAGIVRRRCDIGYDIVVHLRSNRTETTAPDHVQKMVDELLIDNLERLSVPFLVVKGTVEEMVNNTCEILRLPVPVT